MVSVSKILSSKFFPLRALFFYLAIIGLPLICLWSTFDEYLKIHWATAIIEHQKSDAIVETSTEEVGSLVIRRDLHREFMKHGIYVPIEDIILDRDKSLLDREVEHSRKICGRGNAYIWLSAPLKLPILGTKVIEWCKTI